MTGRREKQDRRLQVSQGYKPDSSSLIRTVGVIKSGSGADKAKGGSKVQEAGQ